MAAILFDLDGVFYVGNTPIAGATKVLEWCDRQQIPYLFLTNTTSRPRSALVEKLASFGIATDETHILTPPVAAVRWIEKHGGSKKTLLFVPEATRPEFAGLTLAQSAGDENIGAVVIGDLGVGWDFKTYNTAFQALMNEGKPVLVALGMTRYWRTANGLQLDVGAFATGLEYASDRQAVVMGKPAAPFFQTALDMLGCEAHDAVMIGDDIASDIGGAQKAGIKGVLVKTGKFQPSDLAGEIQPDGVLDNVNALPEWLLEQA